MIGVFLAGSYLIEKVFGIDGIGLLTFKAIGTRDYGIIMGFLVIGVLVIETTLNFQAIIPRVCPLIRQNSVKKIYAISIRYNL